MTTVHVELDQLLNLALGTPEQGAVNFNILHGVLREILSHLGIEKKGKDIAEDGEFRAAFALLKNKQETTQGTGNINDGLQSSKTFGEEGTTNKIPLSTATIFPPFGGNLESKVASIEKKLEILDDLPSNGEILQRAKLKKDEKITPVADMWQFININRRLGAAEIGIEKLTSLLDAMMSEVGDIKDAAKEINTLKNQMSELEKLNTRLNERITALESVDILMYSCFLKTSKLQMIPDDLLDQLNKLKYMERTINQIKDFTEQLTPRIQRNEDRLREDTEREIRTLRDGLRLLNNQLDKLKREKTFQMTTYSPSTRNEGKIKDGDALNALRSLVTELQGEQEKINNTTKELIEEHNRKQKHIDALYTYSDKLQEMKADKEQVAMEMDVKADKHTVDKLVSRSKFDQSIGGLDQSLQELLQRVEGQESALKDALDRIAADIDQKLDRLELNPVKEHFEKKIKNMKCKHVDSLPVNDDPAAGFRKAMLRFHCISCDRPVDMVPGNPNPALPQTPGLPPSRSGRPYTTYELDQMRQIHRGAYTYEQEAATTTARSCGGSHTVTYPHRRSARMSQYYYYREDDTPVPLPQRDETDLIGQDGHIYKGRFDGFDRMPDLPQNPRSPRAMSAKRAASAQPLRSVSPNNRPRSAAVPSALRNQEEEIEPAGVVVQ
ncbi:PREDICTED: glutamine-rich protein 2-like [Acropora digitifera]|uniref:glutamine-rich protein 2-like n=1 Tax=Acropora digitifera TaxID=70779 RepID=UPI00077A23F7|nr:PREDICTED: glutamine-rich protein 2-like [Acropora digitifera]